MAPGDSTAPCRSRKEALGSAVLTAFEPRVHGSPEPWRKAFESAPVHVQWAPERLGWRTSLGPVQAIRQETDRDEVAWALFWKLVWEFRDHTRAG